MRYGRASLIFYDIYHYRLGRADVLGLCAIITTSHFLQPWGCFLSNKTDSIKEDSIDFQAVLDDFIGYVINK